MVLDGLSARNFGSGQRFSALPGHLVAFGKSYRAFAAAAAMKAAARLLASIARNPAIANGDAMSLALKNCILIPRSDAATDLICSPADLVNAVSALHVGCNKKPHNNYVG